MGEYLCYKLPSGFRSFLHILLFFLLFKHTLTYCAVFKRKLADNLCKFVGLSKSMHKYNVRGVLTL